MNPINHAIEGVSGRFRELALLLAKAAEPEVIKIISADKLNSALEAAQRGADECKSSVEAAQQAHLAAQERVQTLGAEVAPVAPGGAIVAAGILGSLLVGAVLWNFSAPLFLVGLAGAAATWMWSQKRTKAARDAAATRAEELAAAERNVATVESALAAAKEREIHCRAALDQAKAAAEEASKPKSIRGIGRVYLPLEVVSLAGRKALVDRSGWANIVPCRLPDFAADADRLDRIVQAVAAGAAPPILLSPDQVKRVSSDALYGQEAVLHSAVDDAIALVESVPTVEVSLRLVPKSNEVAKAALAGGLGSTHAFAGLTLYGKDADEEQAAVDTLAGLARRLGSAGSQIADELDRAVTRLQGLLHTYEQMRSGSLGTIHSQLHEAMSRSAWANLHFYCPQTNRVPAYLAKRLGVTIEEAHLADQLHLVDRLQSLPDVGQRLATDEQILRKLSDAYNSLQEVQYEIRRVELSLETQQTIGDAVDIAERASAGNRLRILRGQAEQHVRQYRFALLQALTGSATPSLELSPQSRLYFDPDTGEWTSPLAQTAYSDMDDVLTGAILAVKDDLMGPMWTHLWTEKADFRRSEQFRTNEQLLRMSEKESEKLISVADQYRADMRMVREQIVQADAELQGKVSQLEDVLQGLSAMGLLDEEQRRNIEQRMRMAFDGDIAKVKKHAELKEFLLGLEPQAQAERRGTAVDPIAIATSPQMLFAPATPPELQVAISQDASPGLPTGASTVAVPATQAARAPDAPPPLPV